MSTRDSQQEGSAFSGLNSAVHVYQAIPDSSATDEPFLAAPLWQSFNHIPGALGLGWQKPVQHKLMTMSSQPLETQGEYCSFRFLLEITFSIPQITTCLFTTCFMLWSLFSPDMQMLLPAPSPPACFSHSMGVTLILQILYLLLGLTEQWPLCFCPFPLSPQDPFGSCLQSTGATCLLAFLKDSSSWAL